MHPEQGRLDEIIARESVTFAARTPASARLLQRARGVMPDGVPMAWMAGLYAHPPIFVGAGQGSRFEDADGNSYCDFNLADLSNTVGYGPNVVTEALARQARRGIQHLLPVEAAIALSEELARRTGQPFWQFTLSASGANTEVIRIARAFTGRAKLVVFTGKYHGHIEPTMVENGAPEAMGLSPAAARDTVVVPFNDAGALAQVLAAGDVAAVMTEPALTNCTLVLPDPGYLAEIAALTRQAGALFCLDETHTWQFAYGGMAPGMGVAGDMLTLGKGLGTGVALGCYGMRPDIAAFLERHRDFAAEGPRGLAIGGTTYGNALSIAAVLAGLEEIQTEAAYARISALGQRLADGLDAAFAAQGLTWRAQRFGPRSGYCLGPTLPRTPDEALPALDPRFSAARRLYLANRGVWDAIPTAGPQVSFAHDASDIDLYLRLVRGFLAELFG